MIKKVCALVLIITVILSAVGCEAGISRSEYDELLNRQNQLSEELDELNSKLGELHAKLDESDQPEKSGSAEKSPASSAPFSPRVSESQFDEEAVIEKLRLTEYTYIDYYGDVRVFLAVQNNSEFDLSVEINLLTYAQNGSLSGAKPQYMDAVEKDSEILLAYSLDEIPASITYDISVAEETWYGCILSSLSYETSSAKNKEIISVTNNSENIAENVMCDVLFFKGGELAGYDYEYFYDNSYELKPGKTISREVYCDAEYDSVKVFLSGVKYKEY